MRIKAAREAASISSRLPAGTAMRTIVIRPAPRRRASLRLLVAAPHRLFFAGGMLQFALASAWWCADVAARHAGLFAPPAWAVPAPLAHPFLFQFTVFPFFMFGFLLTAVPSWTGVAVHATTYKAAGLAMAVGVLGLDAGLAVGKAAFVLSGALYAAGWALAIAELFRIVAANRGRDRYAAGLAALMAVGWAGALAVTLSPLSPAWAAAGAWTVRVGGLWLFLLPVFLVVQHRLIPFFSSRVIERYTLFRPRWSIPAVLAACALHAALETAGAAAWLWVADLPFSLWITYLALRWGLAQSFRAKLLAMLHVSLAALAVGLAASAAHSLAAAAGLAVAGHAPQHLVALGYLLSALLAMVSRVSLGHSGRALEADSLTWRVFVAALAIALARAAADFPGLAAPWRAALLALTALVLAALAAIWAWRYLPMYVQPRADARRG